MKTGSIKTIAQAKKVVKNILKQIPPENRQGKILVIEKKLYKKMGRPLRRERSKLVVRLRDREGWTFEQIAKEIGVKSKSTAHFIYYAEKSRSSK